jgi:hypothetical protein
MLRGDAVEQVANLLLGRLAICPTTLEKSTVADQLAATGLHRTPAAAERSRQAIVASNETISDF